MIHVHILNLVRKSIVLNPYRSKPAAVNTQARLEPEVLPSNASLSSSVGGGKGAGGEEGEEEGEERKITNCFINLFFFFTFVNLNIKYDFSLRKIKGKGKKYCGRDDGN